MKRGGTGSGFKAPYAAVVSVESGPRSGTGAYGMGADVAGRGSGGKSPRFSAIKARKSSMLVAILTSLLLRPASILVCAIKSSHAACQCARRAKRLQELIKR